MKLVSPQTQEFFNNLARGMAPAKANAEAAKAIRRATNRGDRKQASKLKPSKKGK